MQPIDALHAFAEPWHELQCRGIVLVENGAMKSSRVTMDAGRATVAAQGGSAVNPSSCARRIGHR